MYTISGLLANIARGKKGGRPLERDEARWALDKILQSDIDPVQLGAFLVAQRIKEETEDEIVGFIEAARAHTPGYESAKAPTGAVDLPCYAGKRRSAPLHLVAALRARDRGIPVVVHGPADIDNRISARQALREVSVRSPSNLDEAVSILAGEGIVWLDISNACPELGNLFRLRSKLGVRTLNNTVARLLNPLVCDGQLNGISHTPFLARMCKVNSMIGQVRSFVFMSMEGEPEIHMNAGRNMAIQTGDVHHRVVCPAMKQTKPPNPQMNIGEIIDRFQAILAGDVTESEQAVLDRMEEALDWASTGTVPESWRIELLE